MIVESVDVGDSTMREGWEMLETPDVFGSKRRLLEAIESTT